MQGDRAWRSYGRNWYLSIGSKVLKPRKSRGRLKYIQMYILEGGHMKVTLKILLNHMRKNIGCF